MNWFLSLFVGSGLAHSVFILALVIALGILFGRTKFFGISLGITWILFIGIIFSHFNLVIDKPILKFAKEFGLILFVYSIGLQVGPGFFASLRKGGLNLNILAVGIVALDVIITVVTHLITGESLSTMVGVMSGAITNTPGLGAAQQAFADVNGIDDPTIAMGYAVAYPLGVVGVIVSFIALKSIFRVDVDKVKSDLIKEDNSNHDTPQRVPIEISNEAVSGKSIAEIDQLISRPYVISRLLHPDGTVEVPSSETILKKGDIVKAIVSSSNENALVTFLGKIKQMDDKLWMKVDNGHVARKLLVTQSNINGKSLGSLNIRAQYGINITRVNRSGIDLVANPRLQLQMGDRVTVVGSLKAIDKVAKLLGNSLTRLNKPNLFPIFIGIALGVLLGSIPISFPDIPQPVKLGLAGGPLIIALLIAHFGPKYKMTTYTTLSANKMLQEIGISLFLAGVGLGAGQGFIEAIINGGYWWVLYGFIITVIPLMIIAFIAKYVFKMDYFTITGMISGAQTNPAALAFIDTYGVPRSAVSYTTVYPLTMFLRILAAQLMILMM
ncbi:MAG: putative transporter [Bacteroidales bacterium]